MNIKKTDSNTIGTSSLKVANLSNFVNNLNTFEKSNFTIFNNLIGFKKDVYSANYNEFTMSDNDESILIFKVATI